jgi:hypothetical protein
MLLLRLVPPALMVLVGTLTLPTVCSRLMMLS